jgi:hypothetical protein
LAFLNKGFTMNESVTFRLGTDTAHDPMLDRLEFGPGDPNHISEDFVEAWVGRRPVVFDVRQMLKARNVVLKSSFQLLGNHKYGLYFIHSA